MRLAAHPDSSYFLWMDAGPFQSVARCFDGNSDRVLIQTGHGLLLDGQPSLPLCPDSGYL